MNVKTSPDYPNCFTYEKHLYECGACLWRGLGSELLVGDVFAELYELECPSCHQKVTNMMYPTIAQARVNYDKLSESERIQVEVIEHRLNRFEAMSLKTPDQLPDINSESFCILWDQKDDMTVLRCGDTDLFVEPAFFEGYERYEEVALILKERYGASLRDLEPTRASAIYLYGDRWSSLDRIRKFRQQIFHATGEPAWNEPTVK